MIDKSKKNTKKDSSEDRPLNNDKNLENEIENIAGDTDFLKMKSILDNIEKDTQDEDA